MKSRGQWDFSKRRYSRAVHRARRKAGLSLMTREGSLARRLDAIWFASRVTLSFHSVARVDGFHMTTRFGV